MQTTVSTQNIPRLWLMSACILLAYIIPYHMYPFMAFYNDWLAMFGVGIVLVFYANEKATVFSLPAVAVIPVILPALIALQLLLGMLTVPWDALQAIGYFLMAAIATVLGATIAASRLGASRLCTALALAHCVAGVLSVVIASLQFVGAESILMSFAMQMPHDVAIRPYANTGQPNQLALLFCFALASTWWLYQVGRLYRTAAVGIALILLWGLVLTQSRIGWLIIPLFFVVNWLWRKQGDFKVVSGWLMCGFLLVYVVLVLALPEIASLLGVSTFSPVARVGGSAVRIVFLQQALKISLEHPWLGAGWYEFGPQQLKIGAGFSQSEYSHHAHNIVMNFAAELGWPATLLVFGSFCYWAFKACFHRSISKEVGFALLFFIAVSIHSLVEYPLWYAYVLIPTALLVGMVHEMQFDSSRVTVPRVHVLILFLLMSGGLAGIARDYRGVVLGFRALGWEGLGLKSDEGSTDKPRFTLFPHYYDYFRFAKTRAKENMSQEDIQFMENLAKRFGYAPVLMRMSLIYALNDRPYDAEKAMLTINRLHGKDYDEAYQAWKNLARRQPQRYADVFSRLPLPTSTKAPAIKIN